MKKISSITVLFLMVFTSYSQFTNHSTTRLKNDILPVSNGRLSQPGNHVNLYSNYPDPEKNYDYYMQKSQTNRTAGWATLGAGVVLAGVGLLIGGNNNATLNQAQTGAYIMGVGALSGIVSIPFMIMAGVNKRKAKAMLADQHIGLGVPPGVSSKITGITISIPVGK